MRLCAHRRIRAVIAEVAGCPRICVVICCRCAATQIRDGGFWRDGGSLDANLAAPDGYPDGAAMALLGNAESTPARRPYVHANAAYGRRVVDAWHAANPAEAA